MKRFLNIAVILAISISLFAQEDAKKEPNHYANIYARVGYAATFDNLSTVQNGATGIGFHPIDKKLIGGPGAGLGLAYELEYGHFLFDAGIDFTWLQSTSTYALQVNRPLALPYPNMVYHYRYNDLRETRNLGYFGIPIMAGAQFSRYYFLAGLKLGFGLLSNYTHKGTFDVVAQEYGVDAEGKIDYTNLLFIGEFGGSDALGLKTYNVEALPNGGNKGKINLKPVDLTLALEFGIDLDEWLQAKPDPRAARKPNNRNNKSKYLPFTKQNIHYRASIFAEYSVLNGNATPAGAPLAFANKDGAIAQTVAPTGTHSAFGLGGALNNLLVGVKFTVQLEKPKKRPVIPPAPPSYFQIRAIDDVTGEPVPSQLVILNHKTKRATKPIEMRQGTAQRRVSKGDYTLTASAKGYKPGTAEASITAPGQNQEVVLSLHFIPTFTVQVSDANTSKALATHVDILRKGTTEKAYTLLTDSVNGKAEQQLDESAQYAIHIESMGYETYDADITSYGQNMHVQLKPIKKGETFVVKNLFFATNKTRILSTSEAALEELAGYLMRNPDIRIRIVGHTDNVGSDAANQTLSDGRANEVMKDLISRGVAADRLAAEGRGETQPIDTNDTEEGRQNNRRVEVEIL